MPGSSVLRFSEPYEYQNAVRAAAAELLITSPGLFKAELTRIDLPRLWMQRGRESLPRIAKVANATSRFPILFLTHSQGPLVLGRKELFAGEIMIYAPGSEHYQRSSGEVGWAAMSLAPADFAAAGRAIAGRELVAPASDHPIRPPPHLIGRLQHLHEAAGQLAATAPDILAHPEVAKAIEQELVRAMVACLVEGTDGEGNHAAHPRVPVMRRLEQFLGENADTPVYLAEVCTAIGVPARTLRQHCMDHLGMGPHQYLWLRRMNLARRSLIRAAPKETTVATTANNQGFAELGRFAVAYRKLFGESPSATLRRTPEPPRDMAVEKSKVGLPILP
jgi:AraC-like DNA-binding protein